MGVAHSPERTPAHRPASKPNRVGSSSRRGGSRACRLDASRTPRRRTDAPATTTTSPMRRKGTIPPKTKTAKNSAARVPVKPPVECSDECVKLLPHLILVITRRFSTREPVGMEEANSPLYGSGDDKRDHCRYPHGCTARGRRRNQEHIVGFDQHETIPARRWSRLSRDSDGAASTGRRRSFACERRSDAGPGTGAAPFRASDTVGRDACS